MNFQLVQKLFYKYGMIYREVLHSPSFDICRLTSEKPKNILVNQIVTLLNTSSPGLFHPCPYTVSCIWFVRKKVLSSIFQELRVINATVATSTLLSVIPAGDYKFLVYISYKNESIGAVNIIGTMISQLKENFGRK